MLELRTPQLAHMDNISMKVEDALATLQILAQQANIKALMETAIGETIPTPLMVSVKEVNSYLMESVFQLVVYQLHQLNQQLIQPYVLETIST